MKFSDILELVRFETLDNDTTNGYRYSDEEYLVWFKDSLMTLVSRRPDLAIGTDFLMIPLQEYVEDGTISSDEDIKIHPRYNRAIVYNMCFLFYTRDFEDSENAQKAQNYMQLFEREVYTQ